MKFRYLTVSQSPSKDLLQLLTTNIIGTPWQSMLYQHLQVQEKVSKIKSPYFISLERAGHIAGTCCFCKRLTFTSGNEFTSFYVRYFSFKDIFRRKSFSMRSGNRISALRAEVNSLLQGEGLTIKPGEKFFHYAYVDTRNERSAVLCKEFGFEPVRQYTTVVFSRLFPKKNDSHKIVEVEAETVMPLLKEFYQEFTMVSFENLSGRKYYFIENDKGERVAGVQVNPDQWKIHSLPGFFMNTMLLIFSAIPILNRLLNNQFRFLTFENFYWQPGQEKHLEMLMEQLLARYQVYSGLCVVDRQSKLYGMLKSLRLGLMNRLNQEVTGDVICRFENFGDAEITDFKNKPAFISGIDVT